MYTTPVLLTIILLFLRAINAVSLPWLAIIFGGILLNFAVGGLLKFVHWYRLRYDNEYRLRQNLLELRNLADSIKRSRRQGS